MAQAAASPVSTKHFSADRKASLQNSPLIAAVNRCDTQNQVRLSSFSKIR